MAASVPETLGVAGAIADAMPTTLRWRRNNKAMGKDSCEDGTRTNASARASRHLSSIVQPTVWTSSKASSPCEGLKPVGCTPKKALKAWIGLGTSRWGQLDWGPHEVGRKNGPEVWRVVDRNLARTGQPELRFGRTSVQPAPFDAVESKVDVRWSRWRQCSRLSELSQANSGQIWGDPVLQTSGPFFRCP